MHITHRWRTHLNLMLNEKAQKYAKQVTDLIEHIIYPRECRKRTDNQINEKFLGI